MSDLISRDAAIAAIEAEKSREKYLTMLDDTTSTEFLTSLASRNAFTRAALVVSALPPLWVSVKDRLPEPGQKVLVYLNMSGGGVWDTGYHMGGGEWTFTAWEAPNDAATHWMPLPSPPV